MGRHIKNLKRIDIQVLFVRSRYVRALYTLLNKRYALSLDVVSKKSGEFIVQSKLLFLTFLRISDGYDGSKAPPLRPFLDLP